MAQNELKIYVVWMPARCLHDVTRHGGKVSVCADLVTMSAIMSASPHDMNFEPIFEPFLDLTRHGDKVPAKITFPSTLSSCRVTRFGVLHAPRDPL